MDTSVESAGRKRAILPQVFSGVGEYFDHPSVKRVAEFFESKGLVALKDEDRAEAWYADWVGFQAEHRIYASVLSAKKYSSLGVELDLLRYARFLEVFAYFSPAHGYSLQVSFLSLVAVLMGSNDGLKREAVEILERGGLLAFGVSEKHHGSDLLANEFMITDNGDEGFVASGKKYYIGNANAAAMIAILGVREKGRASNEKGRKTPVLIALRPAKSKAFGNVRKIRTSGVRAAFVGEFEVKDHELRAGDVVAEDRQAWDAVLGAVTLGKFFLGFGSIGICERALQEAVAHLCGRVLFGKPVIEMPHVRLMTAQAWTRLTAMKLYAYRALDYVQTASESDRRYLLFCAVQKAKVSTEGVKVMATLSECIGARAFEADTYFEMALRDAQLIPNLEGSTHINLGLTAQFIARYFANADRDLVEPPSLMIEGTPRHENEFLWRTRTGGISTIGFADYRSAYAKLKSVDNTALFMRQAKAFRLFVFARVKKSRDVDGQIVQAMGQCMATIAYGQLIAENARILGIPSAVVSAIYHLLVLDLSAAAMALASLPAVDAVGRVLLRRIIAVPKTDAADWNAVISFLTHEMKAPAST